MLCLETRLVHWESAAVRHVEFLDAALTVVTTIAGVAIALIYGLLVGSNEVVAVGRNISFLIGLMLCARLWLGVAAISVPIIWLFSVFLVGFRSPQDPYPWTVVVEPLHAPYAIVASIVMFSTGTLSAFFTPWRRS
jgi:hypothetical protein